MIWSGRAKNNCHHLTTNEKAWQEKNAPKIPMEKVSRIAHDGAMATDKDLFANLLTFMQKCL